MDSLTLQMTGAILSIYDFMRRHTLFRVSVCCITTLLLVLSASRISFNEDISAFLPLDAQYKESMQVFQDVSGANRLLAVFQPKDGAAPDSLVVAMNDFGRFLSMADTSGTVKDVTIQVDFEKMEEMADFVYDNIPLFLAEEDYVRMDSLLSDTAYTERQLQEDMSLLMFPTSDQFSSHIARDPLNLFTPVVTKLYRKDLTEHFDLYDGYIFTKDMSRAFAILTSPYGNSETRHNAQLMQLLGTVADSVEARNTAVSVHYIGGPAIAVTNSSQIRQDSLRSIALAATLILALLFYAFRSLRNILLVLLSVSWGWLFALGLMSVLHASLFKEGISLIVVGISSIIAGIAVNYPLHLIAHTSHTGSMRQTLREIVSPLLIGNITTVGAFCALIPLQSTALRDLGIFSALLLIGTILFVVLWLPHIVKTNATEKQHSTKLLDWVSSLPYEKNKWLVGLIALLTLVFGWFSFRTGFDVNMSHINYMTDEQRADMELFQQLTSGRNARQQCIYVVSKGRSIENVLNTSQSIRDSLRSISHRYGNATVSSSCQFLISQEEQARRIRIWETFIARHSDGALGHDLTVKSAAVGFSHDAFSPFFKITSRQYQPHGFAYFMPLQSVYSSCLSVDASSGTYRLVDTVVTGKENTDAIEKEINALLPSAVYCFDIEGMNRTLAHTLTDNFNYVGWACALIVFLFLWFSFGNIRLAVLSFLPMAVSWVWILGIMGMLGIQFNIVNVILATFIFGQGDDYTIFITEGCLYEHRNGRKMLAAHKRSIALSALIMFIGIGSLIISRHPALRSLAEVTIVGMFSVVLMAYVIPPFLFKIFAPLPSQSPNGREQT